MLKRKKFIVFALDFGDPRPFGTVGQAKEFARARSEDIGQPIKICETWSNSCGTHGSHKRYEHVEFSDMVFPSNWDMPKREAWTRSVHGAIVPVSFMPD